MPVSLRKNADAQPQAPLEKAPKRDIYDIVIRMVIAFVMNMVTRKLRARQEESHARKAAIKKMAKLAKKGKDIPPDLKKEALAGLSRHKKQKIAAVVEKKAGEVKAGKGKKGKKEKKKHHKLVWLVAIVVAIALVAKAAGKK
jgi:hypothetical protein